MSVAFFLNKETIDWIIALSGLQIRALAPHPAICEDIPMIGLKVKIGFSNAQGESFMGIGLVWLLQRIKRLKSINLAAKDMGMSYAKAHRILRSLEENLGSQLLVRRKGGHSRGGAELTAFAEDFLERYDRHQGKVQAYAAGEFAAFLKELDARAER